MLAESPTKFTATTKAIKVTASPWFITQDTKSQVYTFGYQITLCNLGVRAVQLLSRYWKITDSSGEITHVSGEGVIGEQPKIAPQERYSYQSWSQLNSPLGTMEGHYQMRVIGSKQLLKIRIPCFTLVVPDTLN